MWKSIKEVYSELEKVETFTKNRTNYDLIKEINLYINDNDLSQEEIESLRFEIISLKTDLKKGVIHKRTLRVNEEGKEISQFSLLDIDSYCKYLDKRLLVVENHILKSIYSNIIWVFKHNNKYSDIAINSYRESSDIFLKKINENNSLVWNLIYSLENMFYIAKNTKKVTETILFKILDTINLNNQNINIILNINNLIIDNFKIFRNHFNSQHITNLYDYTNKLYQDQKYDRILDLCELGIRYCNKLHFNKKIWFELMAQCNEKLAMNYENSVMAPIYLVEARKYYQLVGNKLKEDEVNKIYERASDNMNFQELAFDLNIKPMIDSGKKIVNIIKHKSIDEILIFLAMSDYLLPIVEHVKKDAKEMFEKDINHIICSGPVVYDSHKNISKKINSDEEYINYMYFESYRINLDITMIRLNYIILELIKSQKLSYYSLISFLRKNSWFGTELNKNISLKEKISYNWLQLLGEPLREYFNQLTLYSDFNQKYQPSFILCIDSLTIKIEGLLRDLFTLNNIPTTKIETDKNGLNITKEKDINVLLHEEFVTEIFNSNEIALFKFVLTENLGLNLRNKIAHSLIYPQEYSIQIMNILFMLILKLSKYEICFDSDNKENS